MANNIYRACRTCIAQALFLAEWTLGSMEKNHGRTAQVFHPCKELSAILTHCA